MAKRGVPEHPKTLRLARALGVEPWMAVGLLECLWHWCSRYAIDGVITAEPEDVAAGLRYTGDPAALFDALVSTGWLDRCVRGYAVHDAHEHADNTWKANLRRAGRDFAPECRGRTDPAHDALAEHSSPVHVRRNNSVDEPLAHSHNAVTTQSQPSNEPPEPEPEPEPEPKRKKPPLRGVKERKTKETCQSPEPPWWESSARGDPARLVAETVAACCGPGGNRWYPDPPEHRCRELADHVASIVGSGGFNEAWSGLSGAFVEYHTGRRKPPYKDPARALRDWVAKREPDWRRLRRARESDARAEQSRDGIEGQVSRVCAKLGDEPVRLLQ